MDSQDSGLAWSRSDALNRMLEDLYEISASESAGFVLLRSQNSSKMR
ncbi:MAG: hypothetical protein CM1200mP39_21210 [Dehalococcoidia bacterium]|nr:MAG: hypothetical protein CM1200mP39_21210 [Dehalococcoidia bacterium]